MYNKLNLIIVLFFVSVILGGCSITKPGFSYSKNDKTANFRVSKDKSFTYKLQDPIFKYKHDSCVRDAYTIETKSMNSDLMIEYISLYTDCTWVGLPRSLYSSFLRDKTNFRNMELIHRDESGDYEFSTYKTNKNCNLYLITISQMDSITFIVDKSGEFYKDLFLKLNKNYKFKDFNKACFVDFNSSLMDYNRIINYSFQKEYIK